MTLTQIPTPQPVPAQAFEPVASRTPAPLVIRSARDAAALGTILGVWAHPDDEAYLSAGLMALAAEAGSRVVVATATAGEAGSRDASRWSPESLAALRRGELEASLAVLGVREHRWLGHRDGSCARVPRPLAALRLAALLDEVRPDTVVTFGPDGFTGHPDHRAVSRWVGEACARATHPPARLLWAAVAASWEARHRVRNEGLGVFETAPRVVADDALGLVVDPPAPVLDRKVAALRAQASQTTPLIRAVGEPTYRSWWAREHFVEAGCGAR